MKNLTELVIDEKKGKQISSKGLDELVNSCEYAIIVEKFRYKQYIFDSYPEYCVSPSEIYILEAGDNKISAPYEQPEYHGTSLSGQPIDGEWPHEGSGSCKETCAALEEFSKRTGFDANKPHNGFKEDSWMVWFYETKYLKPFVKGHKIFDTRTIVKS